ncbi:unnamed protein product [Adineta steineri]|uniref:Uncharacterized protein n=1 Tax=Adineta steineri TaxID=433720 RepID=A0A815PID0_9BILA|nr:unnamed protein product [Adineta steineri]
MPTCSATSCKNACKLRHHAQCAGTPGSILATCTKTETSHRLSPTKKIKHKTKISSSNKHTNRRNGCVKRHQGFINMPTCSATSCKNACKLRHHAQCAGTPGSILATCTKTKTSHRLSPTKKIKHKTKISSSNKHTNRRT